MKIFILAGGFGTRLKTLVSDVPKPLAPINGTPFLDFQIEQIRKYFFNSEIYLLTHYKSEFIENYYKNDKNIFIIKEDIPFGTGGCILNAIKILNLPTKSEILVLNGDTYLEVNFKEFINQAKYNVNILSVFQEDCGRFGTLEIKKNTIISFREKEKKSKNNYINAGCYLFQNLDFFNTIKSKNDNFALEKEFFYYLEKNKIGTYMYNGIFIDIGVPSDYEKMKKYIGNKI